MITVTLGPADKSHYSIHCRRDDEVLLLSKIAYTSEPARAKVAKQLKVPVEVVTQWCAAGPGTYTHDESAGVSSVITITYHDEGGTSEDATGEPLQLLRNVLTNRSSGFIRWNDSSSAAILDIDFHGDGVTPPSAERQRFIIARVTPAPALWWRSRGGGAHLVYLRSGSLAADVLAAAAGFSYTILDDTATFEVLTNTRVAPAGAELHQPTATDDLSALRSFLSGGVSPTDVDDWLESRGMERNTAYDHKHCPVAGYSESKGTPIWVGENGITCHRCAGLGITYGSSNAGFFPYATLCGSRRLNDVACMIRNFTHWTHAEVVLESRCRLKGKVARLLYEGLLRLYHGEDDRIDRVFTVGRSVIRGNSQWVTPNRNEGLKDIRMTLSGFPAVQGSNGKAIPERLEMFSQGMELDDYGYQSIRPVYGCRIFGHWLGCNSGPPTTTILRTADPQLHPRYVSREHRLAIDEAWKRVDAVFPGINHKYLELLIAARGCAEGEVGLPPNLIVIGSTGTSKSATIHVAASMIGDRCTEPDWTPNPERLRQGYIEACDTGTFVAINEIFKKAIAARQTPRSAFDAFLTMTPDSVSHKLYVGQVRLARTPVTIVTETSVPQEIRADQQLGRRFVFVQLFGRLDWLDILLSSGVKQPHRFRESSVENAEASNAIVSDIIDRYFRTEPQGLAQIAKDLGFDMLEDCDVPLDDPDSLKNFFEVVCKAPDANDRRLKGRGWKKVAIDEPGETDLEEAWRSVCDGDQSTAAFRSSRRCMEVDWSTVVSVPIGTRFEVSGHGKTAAFRFRLGETRGGGEYYVNEQLLTCDGERR